MHNVIVASREIHGFGFAKVEAGTNCPQGGTQGTEGELFFA
jgi:hypothetical protein